MRTHPRFPYHRAYERPKGYISGAIGLWRGFALLLGCMCATVPCAASAPFVTCARNRSRFTLRSRSSIIREEKVAALRDLPMLKDTSLSKREVRQA